MHYVGMPAVRYHLIQPDAPPPLRGAVYSDHEYRVGDFVCIPRRDGEVVCWKVAAIEESDDPTWTGTLRCEYADRSDWPGLPPDFEYRPATKEAFDHWHSLAESPD